MKYYDIDKIIETVNREKKSELLAQLHDRTGIPRQEKIEVKKQKRFSNTRAVVFGVAGIIAVSVAIVVPVTLRNDPNLPNTDPKYTFIAADFEQGDLGSTIKGYAQECGESILYIDWYDNADECITTKYFLRKAADKIIYIEEDLYNGETGDHVRISVIDAKSSVDRLDTIKDTCVYDHEYNGTVISWGYDSSSLSIACFEYDCYKYYIQLFEPASEQAVLDIVKEMF